MPALALFANSAPLALQVPALIREFMEHDVVKKENARLDQLDEDKGKTETDGWRIGDLIRKGKKKTEKIGVVIQVVSKSDNSHVDVNGQPNNKYVYPWVLWEDADKNDAPGRGKQDIDNFRNAYTQTYKNGLGERSLSITKEQLIDAWCAYQPLPLLALSLPPPARRDPVRVVHCHE